MTNGDPAPIGTWLGVDLLCVGLIDGGTAIFDGVDTPSCNTTTSGFASKSMRRYVEVPAGVPSGAYTLEWAASGAPLTFGPSSAARTFGN